MQAVQEMLVRKVLVYSVPELLEDQKSQNHEEAENKTDHQNTSSRCFATFVNYHVFAPVITLMLLSMNSFIGADQ